MQVTTVLSEQLIRGIYNLTFKDGFKSRIKVPPGRGSLKVSFDGNALVKGGRIELLNNLGRFRVSEFELTFLEGSILTISVKFKVPFCYKYCSSWDPLTLKCKNYKRKCTGGVTLSVTVYIDLSLFIPGMELYSDFILDSEHVAGNPGYWHAIAYPTNSFINITPHEDLAEKIRDELINKIKERISGSSFLEKVVGLYVNELGSWNDLILEILDVKGDLEAWVIHNIIDAFNFNTMIFNAFEKGHSAFFTKLFEFKDVIETEEDKKFEWCDGKKITLSSFQIQLENFRIEVKNNSLLLSANTSQSI